MTRFPPLSLHFPWSTNVSSFFQEIADDLIGKARGRLRNQCNLSKNKEEKKKKKEGVDFITVSGKNYTGI